MRVDVWSDVVCPWCYIGKRRFEKALEAFPEKDQVEVVYRSFQLDPTAPRDRTQKTVEMLAGKYGTSVEQARSMMAHVEQTAAGEGLEYHLEQTLAGNTEDAHRVMHLARERGVQDAVTERLFRAYFTEGQSVFDHESLARLASEAGLDVEEVRRVLAERTYAREVELEAREAHQLGANGVPFFVFDGRYGVSGAQPTALFAQALNQAWNERRQLTHIGAGSGEMDLEAGAEGAVCTDDCCDVPAAGASTELDARRK